jgi:predicted transcriptional regulator
MDVLGNQIRCDIIQMLGERPMNVQEICKRLGKEQSLVSHSLKQLRICSFVDYRRKGKQKEYYLKSDVFTKPQNMSIFDAIRNHSETHCLPKVQKRLAELDEAKKAKAKKQ